MSTDKQFETPLRALLFSARGIRECNISGVSNTFLGVCQDIRQHKLMTLRAIVLGTLMLILVWVLLASRLADLDDWLFITGLADIRHIWNGGKTAFSHFLIGGG